MFRDVIVAYFTEIPSQHCLKPVMHVFAGSRNSIKAVKLYPHCHALVALKLDFKVDVIIGQRPANLLGSCADVFNHRRVKLVPFDDKVFLLIRLIVEPQLSSVHL